MASSRWRSVRARTTFGATIVVALALLIGALSFYAILSTSMHATTARAADQRLEELSERFDDRDRRSLDALDDDVAQIISHDGAVIAASEEAMELLGATALPVADEPLTMTIDASPFLIVSDDLDGGRTIVLAISTENEAETLATVATLLAVAVPLLLVLVAGTTWLVTGRALRPVTRIRGEVEAITADSLHRRVEVPPSGDEVAALATTMNGMLHRLDAAASAQRRFVSDASHELRSPLAVMRQHAELAERHPSTTSIGELSDVVLSEGLRLQSIVESLLLLARLDEGVATRDEPIDVDDAALAEVGRLRAAGYAVDGSQISAARATGDPRLFAQVLRNLADNAARHCAGQIAISVAASGGSVMVTVDDDGAGVPEAERERVFERFVRLDEARSRDAGGSGLGLAIVHGIVMSMGGTVRVDSSRWGGARFIVTVPAWVDGES